MVFLTAQLWLRNRVSDRYWRVQEVLKHARHFRGRKNRCYRLAVRAVTRAFVQCTRARRLKKRNLRMLWISRVTAASQEHGLKYPAFILNLIKVNISSSCNNCSGFLRGPSSWPLSLCPNMATGPSTWRRVAESCSAMPSAVPDYAPCQKMALIENNRVEDTKSSLAGRTKFCARCTAVKELPSLRSS
ncbi:large ribosomal subunit protein bL20m isoform X2 [Balaenoptera ricei]|uniref:large ribosomal subunit protein bL20m isoform X2 n=1 Tax=Balaenoptera ricei TaxID=2746895 RepID=UPI0028BDEBE3|nr:large ribosomal subunit protein bL20m isoform X2 [Balaenoptera ricei]